MNKKIVGLVIAVWMAAAVAVPAGAAFVSSPQLEPQVQSTEEEIEIVTDNIVTGGYIKQKGTTEARPLNQIDYPVIKITTVAMSVPANAKVDRENPGVSGEEKADIMTESALTYGKNAQVNDTADRYSQMETTSGFFDQYRMSLMDRLTTALRGNLDQYGVVEIADISANEMAVDVANGRKVQLTFAVPGVSASSQVRVARIVGDTAEFITASAKDNAVLFSMNPRESGVYVVMVRAE